MENRLAHKKPKMPNPDLSRPLDMNIIGSANDPCFGKLHSLTASECRVCGDSEVCSIITGQLVNSEKRAKAHREGKFKDLEEAELITHQNGVIVKALTSLLKKYPEDLTIIKVAKRVAKNLEMELSSARLLTKSYIALNKDKYTYNKETKIVKNK